MQVDGAKCSGVPVFNRNFYSCGLNPDMSGDTPVSNLGVAIPKSRLAKRRIGVRRTRLTIVACSMIEQTEFQGSSHFLLFLSILNDFSK